MRYYCSHPEATISLGTLIIPMFGVSDSLNVSVSIAVLAYEALRQRGRG